MLTEDLKQFVKENCGDTEVGIAPAEDLSREQIKRVAETNRILSTYTPLIDADTLIVQPGDYLDNARAVIVLGLNFYFGRRDFAATPPVSEIMNFYVNPDCLQHTTDQADKVIAFLEKNGHSAVMAAAGIPIKSIAARSGMGRYGKNAVIQSPTLGSWLGILLVVTDAPLEIDTPLDDACGDCTLCLDACPTGALKTPYQCDIERCLTLHMMYNKHEIPSEIRDKAGTVISQCNICLDACPKNAKLTLQTAVSTPEHLVFPEIAPLVNLSDATFQERFEDTFLEFVLLDKKYLQRNAAIALGNHGDPAYIPVLVEAMETQSEELIRTSAAWALGKIGTSVGKASLQKLLVTDPSETVREEIRAALATASS